MLISRMYRAYILLALCPSMHASQENAETTPVPLSKYKFTAGKKSHLVWSSAYCPFMTHRGWETHNNNNNNNNNDNNNKNVFIDLI